MAAFDSWNQMIAAGTHATDGRLCSPLTMGPIAARSQRRPHLARAGGVPMTSDMAKPTAPRLRLVQIASEARPSRTVAQNVSATSAGEGSAYGGLISATEASCHTATTQARNTIGGSTERTKTFQGPGRGGSCGAASSASRPATTARSSSRSTPPPSRAAGRPPYRSGAMTAGPLVQLVGDPRRERADPGRLDGPRLRDVDLPLPDDAPGAGPHEHPPLTEPRGLPHVVRDEDDRQALLRPDAGELLVQDVAGDRVERGERLRPEQHRAVPRGGPG